MQPFDIDCLDANVLGQRTCVALNCLCPVGPETYFMNANVERRSAEVIEHVRRNYIAHRVMQAGNA